MPLGNEGHFFYVGSNMKCSVCRDRGAIHTAFGWVRCKNCKPIQTRPQALDRAIARYVTASTNGAASNAVQLAKKAALKLGATEAQLEDEVNKYKNQLTLLREGLDA